MEEIIKIVEKVSKQDSEHNKQITLLYKRISEFKLTDKSEARYVSDYILPKINDLCKNEIIQRDILYLSLIGSHNFDLLQRLIKCNESMLKVDIENATKLYDYCVCKNDHWFKQIISWNHPLITNRNILNKILVLKLIDITNFHKFALDHVKNLIADIVEEHIEPFWKNYFQRIQYFVKITEYLESKIPLLEHDVVFEYYQENSALQTLSNFLNLRKSELEEILSLIEEEEIISGTNCLCSQFESFIILGKLFTCITQPQSIDISQTVDDIKKRLLNISNSCLQLELLENIFASVFIDLCHLQSKEDEHGLICEEKEARLILYLVREILDEIKLKNIPLKDSPESEKLCKLNRAVADAMWRMELIRKVKSDSKCEKYLLKYMLSPPESLIQMCLKKSDFERAFQVIKIFSLDDPHLTSEIKFSESLVNLRDSLKKTFKIKAIQKVNPKISVSNFDLAVDKTIERFFKLNAVPLNVNLNDRIHKLSEKYSFFNHFLAENEIFMNILDLAVTLPQNFENSEIILQLAFENNYLNSNVTSNYAKFCKRLIDLYREVGKEKNVSIGEMLVSPDYNIDLNKYNKEVEFNNNLSEAYNEAICQLTLSEVGVFNNKHPSHGAFLRINSLCVENSDSTLSETRYLSKLYNYLRAFSRILHIEQNTSDIVSNGKNTSYFDLLTFNRSELMGKLLFERQLDPSEFERYFGKLKLDYLYHVTGNCFPTINLHIQENVTKDELYPENNLYIPNKNIISYIQKRNWLLAYILNKMYDIEGNYVGISEVRVRVFTNYLGLKKIDQLKQIYNGNVIVTALQNEINIQKISDIINSKILKYEKLTGGSPLNHSNESFETGEELSEDMLYVNWKQVYDLVSSIPEEQMKKNRFCSSTKDLTLVNIIRDGLEQEYYRYVRFVDNRDERISTILEHMKEWPGDFCLDVIQAEVSKFSGVQDGKLVELKMWLLHIDLCEKLKYILDVTSWFAAYKMCEHSKENVVLKLLEVDDINLLLDFIDLYNPTEDILELINDNYLLKIFENSTAFCRIQVLLDILPFNNSIRLCYSLIKILKQLDHLKFVVEYLLNNVNDEKLKNVEISLKMLSIFPQLEQDQLLCLLHEPLCILEILIMNVKLDKLAAVLHVLKFEISHTEFNEQLISVEKIDEVLRNYAEKSLDFRIITQPNPRLLRTPDFKLMQSLDSLNLGSGSRSFVMPDEVPSKWNWVSNNEVLECMCCQIIVFSMFNRRHHCRRCGRVICYNCSLHRMLVPTYGDIMVRVCMDCYNQTTSEAERSEINDTVSIKSVVYDYWLLTDDPTHNSIVREEFSYEHAPSVSLCLSLMKYHSKTIEYPKFLLEQCNNMLKLLQPNQEPIQEIDYLLVIKMLKSLAMAAKMSSIECTLHYGTSLADRIISQADLLSLLAERGCVNLLPISSTYTQGPYIDASVLRRLRDRLLEREQWNLALEVSTKAGLDNVGVFAVWGKSHLKAGSLQLAREKFQRCFDKGVHYETLSDYSISAQSENSESISRSRNFSRASSLSESKPTKNPPLLNDIIHILEANTRAIDPDVLKEGGDKMSQSTMSLNQSFILSQSEAAICISNKLKNLKSISSKNYYQSVQAEPKSHSNRPPIHKIFYEECIYYLGRYGSHVGLLDFYVKHGDIDLALKYIIENNLGTDVFIDVYMKCLKNGVIGVFQENISLIDSTLDVWKDYLRHICRHLEKHNLLHSLYQLQQFMGDSIRAAMTCIRFYQENAQDFKDLRNNVQYLRKTEEHLKHGVEQEQWVDVASVRKLSSASGASFEEKGIINPSLVMKINTKDINKHINTIARQTEVAEFLANCEDADRRPIKILSEMKKQIEETTDKSAEQKINVPTLFGTAQDRMYLSVLVIVCGENVEDGFEIALSIIQDFSLKPVKIFCEAGKQLAKEERYSGIAQLVGCIKRSGTDDQTVTDMCDEMLTLAVATFTKANVTGTKVEDLIKLISDKTTKISAYIEAKQLKTAYFLAVKYKRMSDIRRILREAELSNQPSIKLLCQKVLHSHSHAPTHFTKEY